MIRTALSISEFFSSGPAIKNAVLTLFRADEARVELASVLTDFVASRGTAVLMRLAMASCRPGLKKLFAALSNFNWASGRAVAPDFCVAFPFGSVGSRKL